MRHVIIALSLLAIIVLSLVSDWYTFLGISLMVILVLAMLHKIGKGIVLLETMSVLYAFTCVIMPLIGYHFYSSANPLARLWIKYMPVDQHRYFSYALPAISAFCLAINFPFFKKQKPDEGPLLQKTIARIKDLLANRPKTGLYIVIIGVFISFISNFLPVAVTYFAQLFFFGSFAGLLYIHFSPNFKYKGLVMAGFGIFIFLNALQSGMFTIVAYMGITIFSFFRLGKDASLLKKVVLMAVTLSFFIVLQNVKMIYRKQTWIESYAGNKVSLFSNLFLENALKGEELFSRDALFPLYSRTNQGFNVGLVMRRIPAVQPYDNGGRLLKVAASAFVPRVLWPDKPEAGGVFNMKYYAGYRLIGWSTNVGPLGEAYGSFGPTGGILYMLFLGFFIRWVYYRLLKNAARTPLLICWLPVLFYLTISSAETDTMQILNSIIKSAFFIWLLLRILPDWFAVSRPKRVRRTVLPEPVQG